MYIRTFLEAYWTWPNWQWDQNGLKNKLLVRLLLVAPKLHLIHTQASKTKIKFRTWYKGKLNHNIKVLIQGQATCDWAYTRYRQIMITSIGSYYTVWKLGAPRNLILYVSDVCSIWKIIGGRNTVSRYGNHINVV